MPTWNPQQYNRFKEQRSQPFFDLMALVQRKDQQHAVDLGCGTGELTKSLHEKLQIKDLWGIDSSIEMLDKAKVFAQPGLKFERQDIAQFRPSAKLDLVFSNAALQWVPEHERLLPQILSWLAADGEVAIQMPCNFDHPSHQIAAEVGHRLFPEKFSAKGRLREILSLERYAEIFYNLGFHEQSCRIQIYGHPMGSGRDVIEWTKGTLLTSYQAELNEDEFAHFLKTYETRLIAQIGEGPYYYAFKRMLLWGRKG